MLTMWITEGAPACGKSTWADLQAEETGAIAVERDGVRRALRRGAWPHGDPVWERRCTIAHHALIRDLLADGESLIIPDTNLILAHRWALEAIGTAAGALVIIKSFLHVPLELCIERDARRTGREHVGADTIRRMWAAHQADRAISTN